MTGTEGEVTFDVLGPHNKVKVHGNNPYRSSNSYSGDAPSGYKCPGRGSGGNNAAVPFTPPKS
ncbi:hypothetical protein [Streptomyces sp. NPDC088915]|uniref:hypothetical protein n=1 Tax=Streptomyces sp. NPDC088915 TaxID=3365912 RepID=UPI00381E4CF8